jgi:hypothetical protein
MLVIRGAKRTVPLTACANLSGAKGALLTDAVTDEKTVLPDPKGSEASA